MAVTTITSTGYATDSSANYGPVGLTIVLMLMFIGGSAGSTSGGKVAYRSHPKDGVRPNPNFIQTLCCARHSNEWKGRKSECHCGSRCLFRGVHCNHRAPDFSRLYCGGCSVRATGTVFTCVANMGPSPFFAGATILRPILKVVNSSFHCLWFWVDSNSSPCSPCFCKTFGGGNGRFDTWQYRCPPQVRDYYVWWPSDSSPSVCNTVW